MKNIQISPLQKRLIEIGRSRGAATIEIIANKLVARAKAKCIIGLDPARGSNFKGFSGLVILDEAQNFEPLRKSILKLQTSNAALEIMVKSYLKKHPEFLENIKKIHEMWGMK